MITDIMLTEIDGRHWVEVSMDGEAKQYGPYPDADTAETVAARLGAICGGVFHSGVHTHRVVRQAGSAAPATTSAKAPLNVEVRP